MKVLNWRVILGLVLLPLSVAFYFLQYLLFHITEELAARDLGTLSEEDRRHTKQDLERAYGLLIRQWVPYMRYTYAHYPYFFLFAMNTSPFDAEASWLER